MHWCSWCAPTPDSYDEDFIRAEGGGPRSSTYLATVQRVIDGDTIQISRALDNTTERIRLSGIDAPEMKQVPPVREGRKAVTSRWGGTRRGAQRPSAR
jgi:endonuclease YncB( thermonuclease family)